jgi:hypothetical protein
MGGFFYMKEVADPASPKTLPVFKDGPASETPRLDCLPAHLRVTSVDKDG